MSMRTTATAWGLTAAAAGTVLVTTTPASAGGVGDFLSPAFGTSCANHHTGAHATGATTHGTGAADGNLAGLPLGSALNQCGGADAPLPSPEKAPCVIHQWFPGTNILSGNVLNDAVDAPVDVIVQVITLLSEGSITSDKPVLQACG
ncbi:hypothetical protein ACIF8T_37080 [Streptomyces sp. NPDC085946]|uniref:hypothetical protein n=1 Tax=Streptomyces sp. NPDC085946 TaxID=3365744 RepID=UPI0037D67334